MVEPVSWGILGTAGIAGKSVIPAMRKTSLAHIGAIASRDLAKARAAAASFNIPRYFGSYEELIADPGIEAIYNPLPNHLHVPWTIRALEAGKHVLCEKPIALSAAEAQELVDAESRTGCTVREAFMFRHHPQWLRAREIVRRRAIGRVRTMHMFFAYNNTDPANVRNQADIGGGGLYDIGCYGIASSRFIFEADPLRLIGLFDFDPVMKTDRLASAMAEYPGERTLTFTCSTQLAPCQSVEIFGTRGRIGIEVAFNQSPTLAARLWIDDGRDLLGGGRTQETMAPTDQYGEEVEAFSRAIRGLADFPSSLDDAIVNMRAIDALFRSGRENTWQAL